LVVNQTGPGGSGCEDKFFEKQSPSLLNVERTGANEYITKGEMEFLSSIGII